MKFDIQLIILIVILFAILYGILQSIYSKIRAINTNIFDLVPHIHESSFDAGTREEFHPIQSQPISIKVSNLSDSPVSNIKLFNSVESAFYADSKFVDGSLIENQIKIESLAPTITYQQIVRLLMSGRRYMIGVVHITKRRTDVHLEKDHLLFVGIDPNGTSYEKPLPLIPDPYFHMDEIQVFNDEEFPFDCSTSIKIKTLPPNSEYIFKLYPTMMFYGFLPGFNNFQEQTINLNNIHNKISA